MNTESEQPTILPWHREAAKEINKALLRQNPTVSAIIARHDEGRTDSPALRLEKNKHAETLRLLEEALDCISISDGTCHVIQEHVDIREQIRAHLAAMKGTP